jgi:hypothetical protein
MLQRLCTIEPPTAMLAFFEKAPSAFWKRPTIQMKMAGSLSAADATIASIATA